MTNLLKVRKSEKVTRKKICGILELQKPRTTGFTEFQDLGVPGFWNHEFSESLSSKIDFRMYIRPHFPATHQPSHSPTTPTSPTPGTRWGEWWGGQPQTAQVPWGPLCMPIAALAPARQCAAPESRLVLSSRWGAASQHKSRFHLS